LIAAGADSFHRFVPALERCRLMEQTAVRHHHRYCRYLAAGMILFRCRCRY
jgi:hypothetical protein